MYLKTDFAGVDPEVWGAFAFYGALVAIKMLLMAPLTAVFRNKNKSYANPEDAKIGGGKVGINEEVERVRRAHQNDIENILPFFFIGAVYTTIGPSIFIAKNVFRLFAVARIVHTVVYVGQIPQPARALSFMAGLLCNAFMAFAIVIHYLY